MTRRAWWSARLAPASYERAPWRTLLAFWALCHGLPLAKMTHVPSLPPVCIA